MGVTDSPLDLVGAAGNAEVVREVVTGTAEYLIDPVIGGHALVEVHILEHSVAGSVETGNIVAEQRIFILSADKVVCILRDEGTLVGHVLHACVGIEVYGNLAFLTALGGHDDNTVSTAATVDCGGECILQHIDALDVGSRDIGDAFHGEAVHDVQRSAVLCDGTGATDADLHVCIGIAFSSGDLHTGHLTGHCLRDGSHRHLIQRLRIYGRNGTHHVAAGNGSITDDHNLIEEICIGCQLYVNRCASSDSHCLICESDEREHEILGI